METMGQEVCRDSNINDTKDLNCDLLSRPKGFQKIGVTCAHDKLPCDITGACFDENKYLLIADNANRSAKSLNVSDNLIVSVVLLEDPPWDLTYVDDERQVAVTLPSTGKIQLLLVSQTGDLSKQGQITIDTQCRGIVYSRGCFVVSFGQSHPKTEGKVQIIHTNGFVLHTFSKDRFGNDLFQYASHLTLSKDENTIYVTDFEMRSVTSIQIDGTVNAVFTDDKLKDPRGLAVGTGDNLFVCDFYSSCVHVLTKDFESSRIFVDERDGLVSPRNLVFCRDRNTLFVTMFYTRFIAAFRV